jgi:hypothetical protein
MRTFSSAAWRYWELSGSFKKDFNERLLVHGEGPYHCFLFFALGVVGFMHGVIHPVVEQYRLSFPKAYL